MSKAESVHLLMLVFLVTVIVTAPHLLGLMLAAWVLLFLVPVVGILAPVLIVPATVLFVWATADVLKAFPIWWALGVLALVFAGLMIAGRRMAAKAGA